MALRPFEFVVREGEELTLESAVFQAIGAASACWEDISAAGVFDSERARQIGELLLDKIREPFRLHEGEDWDEMIERVRRELPTSYVERLPRRPPIPDPTQQGTPT